MFDVLFYNLWPSLFLNLQCYSMLWHIYHCYNLQAKLHGSANAKVLSVSEKQPPPEEVWTQKVWISGLILVS